MKIKDWIMLGHLQSVKWFLLCSFFQALIYLFFDRETGVLGQAVLSFNRATGEPTARIRTVWSMRNRRSVCEFEEFFYFFFILNSNSISQPGYALEDTIVLSLFTLSVFEKKKHERSLWCGREGFGGPDGISRFASPPSSALGLFCLSLLRSGR